MVTALRQMLCSLMGTVWHGKKLLLVPIPKILERRLDELIEKRCNHYRQMMGCTLSRPGEFVP